MEDRCGSNENNASNASNASSAQESPFLAAMATVAASQGSKGTNRHSIALFVRLVELAEAITEQGLDEEITDDDLRSLVHMVIDESGVVQGNK